MYNFDTQKIIQFEPRPIKFWNPALDFVGMIECLGEIRHLIKTGNMKSDLDIVDVRILQGTETVEEIYQEMNSEKRTLQKDYANEVRTLSLAKSVLHTAIPNLAPLFGKKIFIAGKGKKTGKNFKYDDYIVLEETDARKVGLIK